MSYMITPEYRDIRVPGSARAPEEPPVCTIFDHCEGCPYPGHGFVCWGSDGQCMRETMKKLHEGAGRNDGNKRGTE